MFPPFTLHDSQGWSARGPLIRGTLAAPHPRRSSSNQSLDVLDACCVGNALERALGDANRPLRERHPGHTTAVHLGLLRYAHRSNSSTR